MAAELCLPQQTLGAAMNWSRSELTTTLLGALVLVVVLLLIAGAQ
jgi:hypothetical protein